MQPTTQTTPTEKPTTEQLRQLRARARRNGQHWLAETCNAALRGVRGALNVCARVIEAAEKTKTAPTAALDECAECGGSTAPD